MARGKFNKRGGGPRLDAVNAEEIEIRNQRLAELEEERAQRRADSSDEEGDDNDDQIKKDKKEVALKPIDESTAETATSSKKKPAPAATVPGAPVVVTTEADHNRNMAKLAEVRKRREVAEARRTEQEDQEWSQ